MDELQHDPQIIETLDEMEVRNRDKCSVTETLSDDVVISETEIEETMQFRDEILETLSTIDTIENHLTSLDEFMNIVCSDVDSMIENTTSIKQKLHNYQRIGSLFQDYMKNIVVDRNLVLYICKKPIKRGYRKYLDQITQMLEYMENQDGKETAEEMRPLLNNLRLVAINRSYEFLWDKINLLRRPNTNIQILQNILKRYGFLFQYLLREAPDLSNIIIEEYNEAISLIMDHYFKIYLKSIYKLGIQGATKDNLLGSSGNVRNPTSGNLFALGNRKDILYSYEVIIPHIAIEKGIKYSFSEIFSSMQKLLIDTISSELSFQNDFFSEGCEQIEYIFSTPIDYCKRVLNSYLKTCYDTIDIIIMLKICDNSKVIMSSRGFTYLDPYFAETRLSLSQQLHLVIEKNIESIQNMNTLTFESTRPHYITRRYGEYISSILALVSYLGSGDRLRITRALNLMAEKMIILLKRVSQNSDLILKSICLINNYDLILTIIKESEVDSPESSIFEDLLKEEIRSFESMEIKKYFSELIAFTQVNGERYTKSTILSLVSGFSNNWERKMERIRIDVMGYFTNFTVGSDILRLVLTRILYYYKKLTDLVKSDPDIVNELVPMSMLTGTARQLVTDF
eukprot:TRINITY_DN5122_c0_g1_i1.p1 TRINITY_DN5122_c0_g1~~TRINITY_DN5122_c0_g1_i1.p1  ORF type:complete len:625 (-),score=100.90 TRINITY_DN5122_c0_g1_i1:32-1906(-)